MKDKVKLGPVVDEKTGARAVRRRIELDDGEVREGDGVMIPLAPEEAAKVTDAVLLDAPDSEGWSEIRPSKGPSRTSNSAYREGWDRIFKSKERWEQIAESEELVGLEGASESWDDFDGPPPDKSKLN
jgi:hypothetical protein